MRAVVERVKEAFVDIQGERVAHIKTGLVVLLGVEKGDTAQDAAYLAEKICNLRLFENAGGKMNLPLAAVGGKILAVSQFTLLADCRKGRRPGFDAAAPLEQARLFYEEFVRLCRERAPVETGRFQTEMSVGLINDGPVTILLDSRKIF
jgi:D-tyrosyl-tRNA(Tyr) deacylase